jgi:hypothetical protein
MLARRFAAEFTDDAQVLLVIETHDDAYRAWKAGRTAADPQRADAAALALVAGLGPALPLYLRFYEADNSVPGKTDHHRRWFERLAASHEPFGV